MQAGLISPRVEAVSERDLEFRVLPSVLDVWDFLAGPLDTSGWFATGIDLRALEEDRGNPLRGGAPRIVVLEPNRRIRIEVGSPSAGRSLTIRLTPGGSQGTLVRIEADGWTARERPHAERALRLASQALKRRFGALADR